MTFVLLAFAIASIFLFIARFWYKRSPPFVLVTVLVLMTSICLAVHVSFSTRRWGMPIGYSLCGDITGTVTLALLTTLAVLPIFGK